MSNIAQLFSDPTPQPTTGRVTIGRNDWPVASFAEASRLYELMRDEYAEATKDVMHAPPFPEARLDLYGRTYRIVNGRVWQGERLVYDPPQMELF